jgi:nucleoside 2-deoxyribosyltransferase
MQARVMHKQRLYLAGPLFSEAEKKFNQVLKELLSRHFAVYLPQEDGDLLVELIAKGMAPDQAALRVFNHDVEEIGKCDVFLIILDGRAVDEGAAMELGLAYAANKKCYGLRTDPRQLLATGHNPMIACALTKTFCSIKELEKWADAQFQEHASR